jgi:hypothetical protein
MDFEEEEDDNAEMPVLDPVDIVGVKLPRVDTAGQPRKLMRLMISTSRNPIYL